MIFELIFHKIFSDLLGVAETLQTTVHVAGIPQIFKSYETFATSKLLLVQIEVFEYD